MDRNCRNKAWEKENKTWKAIHQDEVIELARKKSETRKLKNHTEYKKLKREIQSKLRRDERDYLEKKECAKVTECNQERKSREMFEQITKIKSTAYIKGQNQCINNNKEKPCQKQRIYPEQVAQVWNKPLRHQQNNRRHKKSNRAEC